MPQSTVPRPLNNEIILVVINRGLDSLGESPKQAIWYYLETKFKFDQKKIHENLDSFLETLQQFFGEGYKFLDALFRKYLEEVTEEKFDDNMNFVECVNYLYSKQKRSK